MSLPIVQPSFEDRVSFQNAQRGLVASLEPCIIVAEDGREVWNNEDYSFLKKECAPTANPKLWRQGQLTLIQGLFEVTSGIYQVRGFDISNMTLIEGKTGVVVLDCLQSTECAAKALDFYRQHRGARQVKALLYTHCHYDHFSGAAGVLPHGSLGKKDVPVIAPSGFLEEVLKEKVVVGPAMLNRAVSMFGESLPKGPRGHIGCGLGIASSSGTRSLVPPNDTITETGESRSIDGVELTFQMVPDTEAPTEFNVFLPDHRALCIAECATNTMHNIATLRGAAVRDSKRWSKRLDETLDLYGSRSDVLFSSHHWPTWGREAIASFIADQRDLYGYMHDQTVRLMNTGLTGVEIAEQLRLPPTLQTQWHAREYYGALNQNVKGIYQRYMTWFDGNPASLWKHTPAEEGRRYVACMGGAAAVLERADSFVAEGDLRFAITLLDHAVAADPHDTAACQRLAEVYERVAFGAENAVWRNYYLTAAQGLRNSRGGEQPPKGKQALVIDSRCAVEDWLDALSLRVDAVRACELRHEVVVVLSIADERVTWTLRLRNATLTYRCRNMEGDGARESSERVDFKSTVTKSELFAMISRGDLSAVEQGCTGDMGTLTTLLQICGVA